MKCDKAAQKETIETCIISFKKDLLVQRERENTVAITFVNLTGDKQTIARMIRVRGELKVGSGQTQFTSEVKICE